MRRLVAVGIIVAAACATPSGSSTTDLIAQQTAPPEIPDRLPTAEVESGVLRVLEGLYTSDWDGETVADLASLGDPRTAWLLADLMRFYQSGPEADGLVAAFGDLTGATEHPDEVDFVRAMNQLISWDLPAWDGYPGAKRTIYLPVEPLWAQFFDRDHGVDWRLVTWGGVLADQRPLDDNGPCDCIPALDHPATTDATGGDWYADDRVIFGLVEGGEAIAMPRHQMEVHEMVNLTLAGREFGVPYCTLCASAQAYRTDDVPGVDRVVLRTSGLLNRSNKLMYDLTTGSALDTFTGEALTGALADDGVRLEQVSVVASTWGDWKSAHPETLILAQDGGIGRTYVDDPLGGRDDFGPIFPVGDIDPRLPAQEKVVGVIAPDGTPVAFPVRSATEALRRGAIVYRGLTMRLEDAIRVYDANGDELTGHESFWFAWSQFHEGTLVWDKVGS